MTAMDSASWEDFPMPAIKTTAGMTWSGMARTCSPKHRHREDVPRWRSFGELRQEEEGQENS